MSVSSNSEGGARAPAPFLKWAGGKRQLVERILAKMPAGPRAIRTYYEPFVGGGAVFFALAAEQPRRFRRAVLGDANQELVDCYVALRDDVEGVIAALEPHRYDRDYYYELRDRPADQMTAAARAARLIYLNRCGFNGLYRVNSRGLFNVPFGRHPRDLVVCDPVRLRAASAALRDVAIEAGDFERAVEGAKRGDFVYLDPPYVPLSTTAYFTAYARDKFGPAEQQRLATLLRALGERGVSALLSNSDCAETRRLYAGLTMDTVPARRAINSVASRRGAVGELLVESRPSGGDELVGGAATARKKQRAESVLRSRPLPPGQARLTLTLTLDSLTRPRVRPSSRPKK